MFFVNNHCWFLPESYFCGPFDARVKMISWRQDHFLFLWYFTCLSYRCIVFMNFYSAFQNNVEIHINHIQSGLSQMGNLHAFSSSTYKVWLDQRSRPVWLTLNDPAGSRLLKACPILLWIGGRVCLVTLVKECVHDCDKADAVLWSC